MLIQVGIIAYRNKETNQFENATPLYATANEKLLNNKEQFENEVAEFFEKRNSIKHMHLPPFTKFLCINYTI